MLSAAPKVCLVIEDSAAGVTAGTAAEVCVLGVGARAQPKEASTVSHNLEGMRLNRLRAIQSRWLAGRSQGLTKRAILAERDPVDFYRFGFSQYAICDTVMVNLGVFSAPMNNPK